ncbi:MAG TPA: HisA/HisF-related TIM barrel protein, partial [Candidatus Polarisedimenticolia bacterium]|nr:HisA/HisF-related TIM barrel protein [Candidatus Polarisedimenticolia bacterium]
RFLWDGGFAGAADVVRSPRNGRIVPVVGTETLRSLDELRPLLRPATGGQPILGLDLGPGGVHSRSPLVAVLGEEELLRRALRQGFRSVILLFIDRVGTGEGLPRLRLERLRAAAPRADLLVGGGIASLDDLAFLLAGGFSGALLATALHEGLFAVEDLRRARYLN